jgi:hypothetical protein
VDTVFHNALASGDGYDYRRTEAIWFRALFVLQDHARLMSTAPFVYQIHAVSSWGIIALWPFSRLVHGWSIPLQYIGRPHILYRRRYETTARVRFRTNRSPFRIARGGDRRIPLLRHDRALRPRTSHDHDEPRWRSADPRQSRHRAATGRDRRCRLRRRQRGASTRAARQARGGRHPARLARRSPQLPGAHARCGGRHHRSSTHRGVSASHAAEDPCLDRRGRSG